MERVRPWLSMATGMSLFSQAEEVLHLMFCWVFIENELSFSHVNQSSFVQKLLKFHESKKYWPVGNHFEAEPI